MKTFRLTARVVRQLIDDACVMAAAAKIYLPRERKDTARALKAADRVLRKYLG